MQNYSRTRAKLDSPNSFDVFNALTQKVIAERTPCARGTSSNSKPVSHINIWCNTKRSGRSITYTTHNQHAKVEKSPLVHLGKEHHRPSQHRQQKPKTSKNDDAGHHHERMEAVRRRYRRYDMLGYAACMMVYGM